MFSLAPETIPRRYTKFGEGKKQQICVYSDLVNGLTKSQLKKNCLSSLNSTCGVLLLHQRMVVTVTAMRSGRWHHFGDGMFKINTSLPLYYTRRRSIFFMCSDAEVCLFYSRWRLRTTYSLGGQDEQKANVRAIPCQAFQSNWTDTHEDQCSFECITWQIFRLLSLKLCQQKNNIFWTTARGENIVRERASLLPQSLSQNLMDCEHLMH